MIGNKIHHYYCVSSVHISLFLIYGAVSLVVFSICSTCGLVSMATKSDAHHSKPLKSYWYEDDNRDPLVHSRITGIKLKEAGVAGYFFKKETFLTIFTFECKIANYTWSVSRSFEEFKTFHAELFSLYFLEAHKRIQVSCPFLCVKRCIYYYLLDSFSTG